MTPVEGGPVGGAGAPRAHLLRRLLLQPPTRVPLSLAAIAALALLTWASSALAPGLGFFSAGVAPSPSPLPKRAIVVQGAWNTFTGKSVATLLRGRIPDDSWRNATHALLQAAINACQDAWVGVECPPGDKLWWSPPPTEWTLSFPANFYYTLQPEPARTPLAQALFAQLHATGCASWRRGVFANCTRPQHTLALPLELARYWPRARFMVPQVPALPADHPASGPGLPLCDARNLSQLSDGAVEPTTHLWTPRGCRLPYRFPQSELRSCLRGHRVLMVGDSVMRQLLGRTVAAIRGQPLFSEHDFSPMIRYSFDGAHDEVRGYHNVFGPNSDALGGDDFPMDQVRTTGLRPGVDLPTWQFHALWMSDTKLLRWRNIRKMMRLFRPTHLLLGTSYWLQDANESLAAPDRIVHSLLGALNTEDAATASLRAVLWQEFPCHARKAWGDKHVYERVHEPRNAQLVGKLQRTWAVNSSSTNWLRLGFLPTCAVARNWTGNPAYGGMGAKFAVDTVHTSCRWHPAPSVEGWAPPVSEVRATRDLDCSDPIGFTSARVLLSELGCSAAAPAADHRHRNDTAAANHTNATTLAGNESGLVTPDGGGASPSAPEAASPSAPEAASPSAPEAASASAPEAASPWPASSPPDDSEMAAAGADPGADPGAS